MTNNQAIVIAAATLLGKSLPLPSGQATRIVTPDDALEVARQLMVKQEEENRRMLSQMGLRG